ARPRAPRTRTIAQRGDVACVQIVHDTVAVAYDTESDRGAGERGLGEQTDREREGRDVRELTQSIRLVPSPPAPDHQAVFALFQHFPRGPGRVVRLRQQTVPTRPQQPGEDLFEQVSLQRSQPHHAVTLSTI